MPAIVRHFAIHADDVSRAKAFYEKAMGWIFTPWGPPDFYQILDAGSGVRGALQKRHEPLRGTGMRGYEVTIGVDDLAATIARIEEAGGKLLSRPYRIEGVGELVMFEDSEGNRAGVMQYEPGMFD